ncbi:unnamed protein product [Caenorhabditis nigoni]
MSGKQHNEQLIVNGTKPIQEAFKDLMDRIFGVRGHHIHVRHWKIRSKPNVEVLFSTDSPLLETATCFSHGYEDHKLLATAKLLILEVGTIGSVFEFDSRKFSNPRILFKCTDCYRLAYAIASCFRKMNQAAKRHFTFEVSARNGEWNDMVRKFADEETKKDFFENFAFPVDLTIKTHAGATIKTNAGANFKFEFIIFATDYFVF